MGQLPGVSSGGVILLLICFLKTSYALQCIDHEKPCVNGTCVISSNGTHYCRHRLRLEGHPLRKNLLDKMAVHSAVATLD